MYLCRLSGPVTMGNKGTVSCDLSNIEILLARVSDILMHKSEWRGSMRRQIVEIRLQDLV